MLRIRPEKPEETGFLHDFIREAFRTARVSNGTEQDFTDRLRVGAGYVPALALVAEAKGKIVGHIMLTRFPASRAPGLQTELLLAAPLSVAIGHRSKGIGSSLMREAMRRAAKIGYKAVLLVGDPAYYARFGYRTSTAFGVRNTDGIPDRYVQLAELVPGALSGTQGTVTFAGM